MPRRACSPRNGWKPRAKASAKAPCHPALGCHTPRKRSIQYAAAYPYRVDVSGILDRPAEPVIGRAFARPGGGR
ncbi:hypothetical protein XH92_39315 [Bradyrhizobium sp. CCBAU 53421]|nr:hypothetical protein XH92_39315 [Bradyrhizobium sp. CCBAU 53421]